MKQCQEGRSVLSKIERACCLPESAAGDQALVFHGYGFILTLFNFTQEVSTILLDILYNRFLLEQRGKDGTNRKDNVVSREIFKLSKM